MTATEISHLLAARIEDLCAYLLPNGEDRGGEWCVGSLSGEPGGSLKIPLHGPKLGMFRDFAGADTDKGDMIGLWKAVKQVDVTTACQQALDWLNIPQEQRNGYRVTRKPAELKAIDAHWTELQTKLRPGTIQELQALADQRKLGGTAGLEKATALGQLFFTDVYDFGERHPAWILTDRARLNGQARKIDGSEWKFDGKRKPAKSKTVWSPEAGWPVGIHDVGSNDVVLVEGNPDFLAAHQAIWMSGKPLSPVGIFGASSVICDEALPLFAGKTVYLMAHSEEGGAGLKGAQRWERQLKAVGATTVLKSFSQDGVKDLNDLLSLAVTSDQEELVTSLWPDKIQVAEEECWDEQPAQINHIPGVKKSNAQRTPSSFLLTPDDDTSVLLGNRFLNRGDGGILVGSSGMGKSSASIQMSVSWALGLPFMGIKSNGCLRILIIQSEDSDGDIAEVMLSMRHMLHLTDEQINQVDQNVRIVCDRVNRGDAFLSALRDHIKEFQPDLVIINPLQAFIDGDVTESRDLGKFLRGGLNGMNDSKFGFLLVHHTTKPATGVQKSERQWHEVMYDMAGGAELINWARFVISLRAAKTNTPGDFDLVLAKRGRRAGVTAITGEPPFIKEETITSIPVRHATGSIEVPGRRKPVAIIFWEPRQISEEEKPQKSNSGAPEKFPFAQYASVFPAANTPGLPYAQLKLRLDTNGPIGKGSFANLLKKWERDSDIEIISRDGQPTLYRKAL